MLLLYILSYPTPFFTANVTTTDYLDELTLLSEKEKEPFKTNGVVYSIIGLAAISVLLIILYLCSHLLEKYSV